jgi:hypothetical protein
MHQVLAGAILYHSRLINLNQGHLWKGPSNTTLDECVGRLHTPHAVYSNVLLAHTGGGRFTTEISQLGHSSRAHVHRIDGALDVAMWSLKAKERHKSRLSATLTVKPT